MKANGQLVTSAQKTDAEVRSLMEQGTRTAWRVADLCRTVRDERLWEELNFTNFDLWLEDAVGVGRSTVYRYMGLIEVLQLPVSELDAICPANAEALLSLSDNKRTSEEWIEKAKTLTPKEMKAAVNAAPGSRPIEDCYLKFKFHTPEERETVREMLEKVKFETGIKNPGTALTAMSIAFGQHKGWLG